MKPPPFAYCRPETAEEAVHRLTRYGPDARVLAGGQSLLPLLNRRLLRPTALVDVGRIAALRGTGRHGGGLHIGALTTHADLERAAGPHLRAALPVVPETARLIGHLPVRLRGTIGGSLAHADPAAEWCLLAVLLDADMHALGPAGERTVPAAEFFTGAHRTALAPGELLTGVRIPRPAPTAAVAEYGFQPGSLPLVAAAAELVLDDDGRITAARIAVGGAEDRPVRSAAAEQTLLGGAPDARLLGHAADLAAKALAPGADHRAGADYRRDLARTLVHRALADSLARCTPRLRPRSEARLQEASAP
ncbi:FAD binding domain-containing protein [Kitasatospora sp. NPDC085895]|uniref:FAD binding domain-containing protein n=1 Tax=Kitasatospora sp. NPDC085895 TaxID=3155057 RepID=UPI00344DE683